MRCGTVVTENRFCNIKAFQSNANCPLADSPGYIVNKFGQVWGRGRWFWNNEVQVEHFQRSLCGARKPGLGPDWGPTH